MVLSPLTGWVVGADGCTVICVIVTEVGALLVGAGVGATPFDVASFEEIVATAVFDCAPS
jgi:hypothetical protein